MNQGSGRWKPLSPGTQVRVRSRFDGTWVPGFEVSALERWSEGHRAYRLRRVGDGRHLPAIFHEDDVRPDRGTAAQRRLWSFDD